MSSNTTTLWRFLPSNLVSYARKNIDAIVVKGSFPALLCLPQFKLLMRCI